MESIQQLYQLKKYVRNHFEHNKALLKKFNKLALQHDLNANSFLSDADLRRFFHKKMTGGAGNPIDFIRPFFDNDNYIWELGSPQNSRNFGGDFTEDSPDPIANVSQNVGSDDASVTRNVSNKGKAKGRKKKKRNRISQDENRASNELLQINSTNNDERQSPSDQPSNEQRNTVNRILAELNAYSRIR